MIVPATLLATGKTSTGVVIDEATLLALGGGKKPSVQATIRGYTWRTALGSMGGRVMLPVSADVRSHAGIAAGDSFDLELVVDSSPRVVEVPPDLQAALDAEPAALAFFGTLPPSQQRWFTLSVEGAKQAETRARRVQKAVTMLAAGERPT